MAPSRLVRVGLARTFPASGPAAPCDGPGERAAGRAFSPQRRGAVVGVAIAARRCAASGPSGRRRWSCSTGSVWRGRPIFAPDQLVSWFTQGHRVVPGVAFRADAAAARRAGGRAFPCRGGAVHQFGGADPVRFRCHDRDRGTSHAADLGGDRQDCGARSWPEVDGGDRGAGAAGSAGGRSVSWERGRRMSLLELENITAAYGHVQVLHGVSLRLEPGGATGILGANGREDHDACGRSAGW